MKEIHERVVSRMDELTGAGVNQWNVIKRKLKDEIGHIYMRKPSADR